MRTWISLPRPPLPLLPLPLPSLSVALPFPFPFCAAVVVAVEERDGGGGEWRFGSPFRAGAATADAAYSIIPIVAAATAASWRECPVFRSQTNCPNQFEEIATRTDI